MNLGVLETLIFGLAGGVIAFAPAVRNFLSVFGWIVFGSKARVSSFSCLLLPMEPGEKLLAGQLFRISKLTSTSEWT